MIFFNIFINIILCVYLTTCDLLGRRETGECQVNNDIGPRSKGALVNTTQTNFYDLELRFKWSLSFIYFLDFLLSINLK